MSMLSYGALERSNNSHIESIVKPCVSQNQKHPYYVGLIGEKNPEKRGFQNYRTSKQDILFPLL